MNKTYAFPLRKRRVAVRAEKIGRGNTFKVLPGLYMLSEATLVCEQPSFKIVGDEGEEIKPTGNFVDGGNNPSISFGYGLVLIISSHGK